MDLRSATLKAASFYFLHSVSTLNQCRKFPVSQLYVNTLPATKITLITNRIEFDSLRVKWIRIVILQFAEHLRTLYQYNETNVMHISFSLLRIKALYMVRAF
jgi:hypothetical protein